MDLTLQNSGEAEIPWPNLIRCRLSPDSGGILAGDALGGYRFEFDPAEARTAVFRRNDSTQIRDLPPGGKKPLGWLRFTEDSSAAAKLSVTVE